MSHIYIYSPSSAVRDKAAFRLGIKRLRALGHAVEIDADALSSHQRFAGDDASRYGLTRLLADLPYAALAKAIESGTQFVGLSDFTALQLGLMAKTGAITWQGPCVLDDFGTEAEPDDIMQACLDDLLLAQGEGVGWRLPRGQAVQKDHEIHGAKLWGGNLSVLVSLLGTPYFPKVRGGVLFLEDVGEHPYRMERMLTQLLHSGVLGQQKALVLGQFTNYKLVPHDKGFKFDTVVQWLRTQLSIPIVTGLPLGHVPTKVLLPVGAKVDLVLQGQEALMAWGHL